MVAPLQMHSQLRSAVAPTIYRLLKRTVSLSRNGHLHPDALRIVELIQRSLFRQFGFRAEPLYYLQGSGGIELVNQSAEMIDLGRFVRLRIVNSNPGLPSQEERLRIARRIIDRSSEEFPVKFDRLGQITRLNGHMVHSDG